MKQDWGWLHKFAGAFGVTCLSVWLGLAGRAIGQDLRGRVIVGYQGWFSCPGELGPHGNDHWRDGGNPRVEMLPDLNDFPASDTCAMKLQDGETARVYSSANKNIIDHHFAWMQEYRLDIAAVQRFASVIKSPTRLAYSDTVLFRVQHAAEAHGRGFFLEYDLSGSSPADAPALLADWIRLCKAGVPRSKAYQLLNGQPMVGFFGLGFAGRPWTALDGAALIRRFRNAPGGAAIMLGIPAWWRTGTRDASPDPAWLETYRLANVLSPWTVGRFADAKGAKAFAATVMAPDAAWAKNARLTYMPVAFPGFSWANLKPGSPRNAIPRAGGAFFRQQFKDMQGLGIETVFIAMFDEVNEGTAIFKLAPHAAAHQNASAFLALDADGFNLAPDYYLRTAQSATAFLKR